jgi:hypothetical protein
MAHVEVITGTAWTTFQVKGDPSAFDIVETLSAQIPHLPFPAVIWDLSEGSVSRMTRADFAAIGRVAREHSPRGGLVPKIAFVGSTSETFILTCMYSALAAMTDAQLEYRAFLSLAEAERWIVQPVAG